MKVFFSAAAQSDAAELAALHAAIAEDLTRRFGHGHWSSSPSEKHLLRVLARPKFERFWIARTVRRRIVATLRLATKKPWAIDTAYYTPVKIPLYLTGMAVHPDVQRQGIGRRLMVDAARIAQDWPADAIRLDAYNAAAGAGPFSAKCGFREVGQVVYKGNPLLYFELLLPS
ncbi:MAG TPA: GNAT family N-acetyltransferase [Bryobacteraceae bacterium]|nr:GNAT family N-acetyltransferase [Bryobacteraceae bacterium]